ncbi:MAG: hypothetical protein ACPGU4_10050, partial [Flavobacteriales bacterium]
KNYQITRTKLYDSLMQALREHGKSRFPANRFFLAARDAHILSLKGLYKQAKKLLTSALAEAQTQNQPAMEQMLLKELNKTAIKNGNHHQIIETIDAQIANMERAKQLAYLAKYYEQVFEIQRKHGVLDGSQKEAVAELKRIEREVGKMDTRDFLPSTKFNYNMLHQVIAFTLADTPKALKYTEKVFRVTQENPEILKSRKDLPIKMLSNLIQDSLEIRDSSYYNQYIAVLKGLPTSDNELAKMKDSLVLKTVFRYDFFSANFKNYQEHWSKFRETEEAFDDNTKVAFCGDIAHLAFINQDYRLTVRIINHLIDLTRALPRTDVINNMEVLLLLAHFELQNFDTVDQLIKSVETRAGLHQDLSQRSFDMIKLVKALNGLNDEKEQRVLTDKYISRYESHFKSQTLTSFSPVVWALSKSNGTLYQNEFTKFFNLPID